MNHDRIEKYARMANQIGDYFATLPPEEGAAGVALHIARFWTPKMIAETRAAIESGKVSLNETTSHGFVILAKELATAG